MPRRALWRFGKRCSDPWAYRRLFVHWQDTAFWEAAMYSARPIGNPDRAPDRYRETPLYPSMDRSVPLVGSDIGPTRVPGSITRVIAKHATESAHFRSGAQTHRTSPTQVVKR